MAFNFNGNFPQGIKFNSKYVEKLKYNNQIVWEKKLPDEYQEVEYLSMSNGPKINTDLTATPSQNTLIEIIAQSFSSSEAPTARKLVAVSDGSGNFFGDNNGFWVASGVNTQISALDKTKIRLSFTKKLDIEIGDQKWSVSRSGSGSGNGLKLFKTSTSYRGLVGKCFGCKIWQENQLVRDYVCCYRKSDNEPGLYDLANDVFYTNEGTGNFLVGPDIVNLPSEYQQVEYLETTGSQYINTGYYLKSENIKIKTKIETPEMPSSEQDVIGNYNTNSGRFVLGLSESKVFGYSREASLSADTNCWSSAYSGQQLFTIEMTYDYINKIKTLKVNGEINTATQNRRIASETAPVYIMNNAKNSTQFIGKLFYLKLFMEDELVFDLVPCYRKSDNKPGLYDAVNDVFYTNQGTGEFTVGEDVN